MLDLLTGCLPCADKICTLSRKWLPIFDASIQIVFDFAVLCEAIGTAFVSHIPNQTAMKVLPSSFRKSAFLKGEDMPELIVRLSPIQFLAYIETRCMQMYTSSEAQRCLFVKCF